jgi:hypothetical protein
MSGLTVRKRASKSLGPRELKPAMPGTKVGSVTLSARRSGNCETVPTAASSLPSLFASVSESLSLLMR